MVCFQKVLFQIHMRDSDRTVEIWISPQVIGMVVSIDQVLDGKVGETGFDESPSVPAHLGRDEGIGHHDSTVGAHRRHIAPHFWDRCHVTHGAGMKNDDIIALNITGGGEKKIKAQGPVHYLKPYSRFSIDEIHSKRIEEKIESVLRAD